MNYNLICIRHGEATHNTLYHQVGMKAFFDKNHFDTELTEKGYNQAIELGKNWNLNIDLIIVSPLKRTLQTAINVFKNIDCPIIALDNLKEYPQGLHTCNKRSDKKILQDQFLRVDFSLLDSEKDEMWSDIRLETIDELLERINKMYNFIENRSEKNIVLVGHNGFISMIKDGKFNHREDGDEELKHCYPYKIELKF